MVDLEKIVKEQIRLAQLGNNEHVNPAIRKGIAARIRTLKESPRDIDALQTIIIDRQREFTQSSDRDRRDELLSEIEILKWLKFAIKAIADGRL